ncbi:hypothetical protein SAMN05443665_103979 [Actinomadura meyerae]|uniref:Uncharacterized protein n=1 Tax=Actinomadura meyerae TaxID=240840 RepID=A0A239NF23_9ACTN|nr:hypothetical protein [Actinomadura meyerae]SNT53014.1 hypothetical protein SAMN05443665_103979 [Actinomadura meyerae]
MTIDDQTAMPAQGRRAFLAALDEAVRRRGGMACGIVQRSGTPVLYVINTHAPGRSTEVGADYIGGAWMFTWAGTGATISAAEAPTTAADAIARAVGAHP